VKQIVKTNDSIWKKYRVLKTNKIKEDIALERHFESLAKPLKQIVENTKKVDKKSQPIKKEANKGYQN